VTDVLRADGWKKPFAAEVLEAFENLKVLKAQVLKGTAPRSKNFDVDAESMLSVDASGYWIGAMLQ
jgi:hypothetical protein